MSERPLGAKALLLAAALLVGCSATPQQPRTAADPLPQHLLGAWSASPVTGGHQPDFVFEADAAPCPGLIRTRFGNGLTHDTPVSWSAESDVLVARAADAEVARLAYAPDGFGGTLLLTTTQIAQDGNRAELRKTNVKVQKAVRRQPPVPLVAGANFTRFEVDRVVGAGNQLLHCEVFHYLTDRSEPEVVKFYQGALASKHRPPEGIREGRLVRVLASRAAAGTSIEIVAER